MPRIEAYAHQVGGHCQIVKPVQSSKLFKPFNAGEHEFYEAFASVSDFVFGSTSIAIYGEFESPVYVTYADLLKKQEWQSPSKQILDSFTVYQSSLHNGTASQLASLVSEECMEGIALRDYGLTSTCCTTTNTTTSTASSSSTHGAGDSQDVESEERSGNFFDFVQSGVAFDIAKFYPLNVLKAFYLPRYHGLTEVQLRSIWPTRSRPGRTGFTPPRAEGDNSVVLDTSAIGNKAYDLEKRKGAEQPDVSGNNTMELRVLEYIVLDDLVDGYRRPCVLDLKMGRRQKKLGASEAKKLRQTKKSMRTTSYALGFRLCGCKVYDKKNDVFYGRDKYWGRELKVHQVRDAIKQFFCDGYSIDWRLIESLILRLKILYECIKHLPRFRFWSSSLLWVFDGGIDHSRLRSLDVKLIDFTNTVVLPNDEAGPDMEYLYGLENLVNYLESIVSNRTQQQQSQS